MLPDDICESYTDSMKTSLSNTGTSSKISNLAVENEVKGTHNCTFSSTICTFEWYTLTGLGTINDPKRYHSYDPIEFWMKIILDPIDAHEILHLQSNNITRLPTINL